MIDTTTTLRGTGATDPQPLVSVIVRSMGRPSLAAALASIARQDYRPIEIVVVAALGPEHPPLPDAGDVELRLVSPPHRLLRSAAANAGLDSARGEWITFLDDDDLFEPGHLGGLMAARQRAASAGVLHSQARAVFTDGSPASLVGHPHAPVELYERNYIHLSAALVHRPALGSCRFDESLDILEDWDFFLQLSQRAAFFYIPQSTFVWHAEAGDSGAGSGPNYHQARFAAFRKRLQEKWRAPFQAAHEEVTALLEKAQQAMRAGDGKAAELHCLAALRRSQNHPAVLNTLAILRQRQGDLVAARGLLELANAIRAEDVALLHNLALVSKAQGDRARASACVRRAVAVDPSFAPALRLQAQLQSESA